MEYRACSFTGHRQILPSHLDELVSLLGRGIAYCYDLGCRDFFAGGALGFDTLAAEEVVRFRMLHSDVKLHLLLPCRDQTRGWRDADIKRYERLLSLADTVTVLSEHYYDGCMQKRNRMLVDFCDVLLAYCTREKSGAAQTVGMAKRAGKKVYNLASGLSGFDI